MADIRIIDAIFQNAGHFSTEIYRISHAPIEELLERCSKMFDSLERDDPFQRDLSRCLWTLRATILFTLLPFDHSDLGINGLSHTLLELANRVPAAIKHAEQIDKIIKLLRQHPSNPKRNRILEILDNDHRHGRSVAVITALSPGIVPGWPLAIFKELKLHPAAPTLITSRKMLVSSIFDRIVLPSNCWNCSFELNYDLNYGCRARVLDVFLYGRESFRSPKRYGLPKCRLFSVSARPDTSVEDMPPEKIDGWVNEEFWSAIRSVHGAIFDSAAASTSEAIVKARYVIFSDGRGTFLPEERKVIEISDLIDERATIEGLGGGYPRKHVSDLVEGDLVVLRLSGSGDYLEKVADEIISKEGKGNLRQRATDWKSLLHQTLQQHGADKVAEKLMERGFNLSSPGYVWVWTTNMVISPQNEVEFHALMDIVSELGQISGRNPAAYASERWGLIRELKKYHLKAGNVIRQAMLKRIAALIKSNTRIDKFMNISLPDVDAGEMGILRVSAVDHSTVYVPYTKINQLEQIGDR